jgi:hypothetical protein
MATFSRRVLLEWNGDVTGGSGDVSSGIRALAAIRSARSGHS